jgi:hypothetical protein
MRLRRSWWAIGPAVTLSLLTSACGGDHPLESGEERHRALLGQVRVDVERCTDDRAVGTIMNTADEAIPNVTVTVGT